MADLNPAGQVQSPEQIRAHRRSRGYCDTCRIETQPVQCYEIKKRLGGMLKERAPLTRRGWVFNGTCLVCHPDRDPDVKRHQRRTRPGEGQYHRDDHRRSSQPEHYSPGPVPVPGGGHGDRRGSGRPLQYNIENTEAFRGDEWMRGNSLPSMAAVPMERPNRQGGVRDLAQSLPTEFNQQVSIGQQQPELEDEYYRNDQKNEYVEVTERNIFGDQFTKIKRVSKPKRNRRRSQEAPGSPGGRREENGARSPPNYPTHRYGGMGTSPPGSPGYSNSPAPQHRSPGHASPRFPYEEKVEEQAPDDFEYPVQAPPYSDPEEVRPDRAHDEYRNGHGGSPRVDFGRHPHPYHQDSGRRPLEDIPAAPDLTTENGNSGAATAGDRHQSASESTDDGSLDELAALVARHCARSKDAVKFVPGDTFPPNAELTLQPMDDTSIGELTLDTCWKSRGTMGTMHQLSRPTNLTAISEAPGDASSGPQRSIASHEIKEPAAAFDMETHLESSAPELATLREIVRQLTQIGDDLMAIDTITQALIHDNATSMSKELALFCLTTLWVLARKSDENKRTILLEGRTFDAIVEAMQIYREILLSVEIQTRACGVLWSLSMDPKDRKHVAQGGGCDAILNAMLAYTDDDELQVMALGALKVLSFDSIGKSKLRSEGASAIVSDIMRRHDRNPTIQSEGCVIIGNLAIDETNQFVAPVSEAEVNAVVGGVLAHPESLEVHSAAVFTLMSLASSAANVDLIRHNSNSRLALELAFQRHPDDVGANILTLLKRLKFE